MKTRTAYKQTEIGEIPEEWEICRIGEFCEVRTGGTPSMNHPEYFGGNIKWIRSGDIHRKRIFDVEGRITTEGMNNSNAKLLPVNSVLVAMNGRGKTRASVAILKTEATCNQSLAAIITKDDTNPEYLMYHLENRYNELRNLTGDNDRSGLNLGLIRNLLIAIPKLQEQQKIAEILSTVDDAIQKSDEIIQKTQLLKKGLLHQLLTRGIGHSKFKQTEIGEIPEEWEYGNIENFANTVEDCVQTGPFGAQLHASDYVKDGVPLILIKNVFDGKIVDEEMPRISHKKAEELSRYRLTVGDIVFSRVGSVGRAAVVREREKGWLISGQMLRVRLDNPRIENDFLGHVINTKWFKKALESKTVGATRKSINTSILRSLPLVVPPLPEQQKIAKILSTVDKKIEAETERKEHLQKIKAGLMNDLLTGKRRVKVEA